MSAQDSVAVVTGSSRGIGLQFNQGMELAAQLVKDLAAQGHHVVATCRQATPELLEAGAHDGVSVLQGVDVGSDDGCQALESLQHARVDLVICNAGLFVNGGLDELNFDDMRRCYEVNALGPLRTVKALLPKLQAGSKVVIIGSKMGSIGGFSGNRFAYRMSKCAAHMAGNTLAFELKEKQIPVGVIHPGVVITDMTQISGSDARTTVQESAAGILARAAELKLDDSGKELRDFQGNVLPW